MVRRIGEVQACKGSGEGPKFPDKKEDAKIIKLPAAIAPKKISFIRSLTREKKAANAGTRADYNESRADLLTRGEEIEIFKIYETIMTRAEFIFRHLEPDEDKCHMMLEGNGKKDRGRHYREMFLELRKFAPSLNGAKIGGIEIKGEVEVLDSYRKFVEELVCSTNIRLVFEVAKKQGQHRNLDRIQDGLLGICRAIETFDYRRGNRFSTYAAHQIRAHIRRGRIDKERTIRIPSHIYESSVRVNRVQHQSYLTNGVEAEDEEVMKRAKVDRRKLDAIKSLPEAHVLGEDDNGRDVLQTRFGATDNNADIRIMRDERLGLVTEALWLLNRDEKQVMQLRLGMDRTGFHTLGETANRLGGVTRERARQIEANAITLMKAYIALKTGRSIPALEHMSREERLFTILRFNLDGNGMRTRADVLDEMKVLISPKELKRKEFLRVEAAALKKIFEGMEKNVDGGEWKVNKDEIALMKAGEPLQQETTEAQPEERKVGKPRKRTRTGAEALALLDERERQIIGLRDNLDGHGYHGVLDIEKKLGLGRSKVFEIEKRARALMEIYLLRKRRTVKNALKKMDKEERFFATLRFDLDGEGLETRGRIEEIISRPDLNGRSLKKRRTAMELEESVVRKILDELKSLEHKPEKMKKPAAEETACNHS